ncbi:hypothetical protein [Bdellovibrio sp. BCCA]|uniref:hypothetical protein n=1 Tax=Bdellovibrio sp. BCCA TaxID=3136281 RepID=UPI0030F1B632
MLRAGRFRHRLLDDEFLKNQGPLAFQCLQSFLQLWRTGSLNDVEMASAYILIFAFLRRPKDFLGGVHNELLDRDKSQNAVSSEKVLSVLQNSLPASLRDSKSLQRLNSPVSFVEHFCSMSWRSIPLSVQQSLSAWSSGRYPLRLLTTVPTPEEVLEMQAQGLRCISMLIQENEICHFVEEGRDVLGFIVHDLIHADHFFADPVKAQAQIHFCQKLLVIEKLPEIQKMLSGDITFKGEFHYLMSDMNSVPLHLLKTLKAILLGYFKRRENAAMNAPLPPQVETEFLKLFKAILDPWSFPQGALEAAYRLNTPLYKGLDDSEMLHLALSRSERNFSDESTFV